MVDEQRDRDAITSGAAPAAPAGGRDAPIAPAPAGEPDRIGPYKVLERAGEGEADVVFKAEEDGDDDLIVSADPAARGGVATAGDRGASPRLVALRLIREGLDWRRAAARLDGEWPALARLDHPNIARVLGAGTRPTGQPYLVSAWVDGIPITRYCDDHRLPIRRRIELFLLACEAMQYAHRKGAIHGDLRPSSVLVPARADEPSPKVLGFGAAPAIRARPAGGRPATEAVAHPEYLSPELADREAEAPDIDTRTDVYGLGVVLYELLTGTTPLSRRRLEGVSQPEALRMVREDVPPRPSERLEDSKEALESVAARRDAKPKALLEAVRGDLDCVAMKALEKDPERRYATVHALARDLRRHLDHLPPEACPAGPRRQLAAVAREHRGAAAMAGAVLLLLLVAALGGAGLAYWAHRGEERAKQNETKADASREKAEKAAEEMKDQADQAEAARRAAINERDRARAAEAAARRSDDESRAVLTFLKSKMLSAGRPGDVSLPDAFWAAGRGKDVTLRKAADMADAQVPTAFADRPLAEAQVREILGMTFLDVGDPTQAVKEFERALALREALQGPNRPEVAECRNRLAVAYRLANRTDEAGRLFNHSPESPSYASALDVRGQALLLENRPIDAELKFRECLAIRQKVQPDDWTTFETMTLLGRALLDQRKFAEAEPLLKSGFEGMERRRAAIPAGDRPRLASAAERLVKLYEGWGKASEADAWRKRLEEAREQARP